MTRVMADKRAVRSLLHSTPSSFTIELGTWKLLYRNFGGFEIAHCGYDLAHSVPHRHTYTPNALTHGDTHCACAATHTAAHNHTNTHKHAQTHTCIRRIVECVFVRIYANAQNVPMSSAIHPQRAIPPLRMLLECAIIASVIVSHSQALWLCYRHGWTARRWGWCNVAL